MSEEKCPKGQVQTAARLPESLLTYADLLQLEWVFEDKIEEWKWRNNGQTDSSIDKSLETLKRIRETIRLDDLADREEAENPVKLVLGISPQTYEAAERLTRRRCLQSLPETVVELVSDMAECETRPGSWEAEKVRDWMESRYLPLKVLRATREGVESC
jgi:hypothetical protein